MYSAVGELGDCGLPESYRFGVPGPNFWKGGRASYLVYGSVPGVDMFRKFNSDSGLHEEPFYLLLGLWMKMELRWPPVTLSLERIINVASSVGKVIFVKVTDGSIAYLLVNGIGGRIGEIGKETTSFPTAIK